MIYHFKVHKEDDEGFWAECIELRGCATQADTFDVLLGNMNEALELYLDEPQDSDLEIQLPNQSLTGKGIIGVAVSPNVALALSLRLMRKKHKMTQKEAAHAMGFKGLFSYQRLESSKTANPELNTLDKIKGTFPEFSLDAIVQGTQGKNIHVVPLEKGWGVIKEKDIKLSTTFRSRDEAMRDARRYSKRAKTELTIRGSDGKIIKDQNGKASKNRSK